MTTLILGNITLLPESAIVHEIKAILQCNSVEQAETVGEKLINLYDAYLIPEAYKFPITWECEKRLSLVKEPIHKSPEPTEEDRFLMEYVCSECGAEWSMAGSCACNDHCPQCDAEITPTIVRDIE